MAPKPQKVVPAKVVDVDDKVEPIESVVVGDARNTLGKRLGYFAVALLLLFFSIGGYIQSAKNGAQLNRAAKDRSALIQSNLAQNKLISKLQGALRDQNKILRKAGFKTVKVPGRDHTTDSNPVAPRPSKSPQPRPTDTHKTSNPSPKPSNSPTPKPTHSPEGLVDQAEDRVCSLTGICMFNFIIPIFFKF